MGDNGGKAFTLGVDWPGRPLPMMPGDFNRIVPHGMALVVRASDNLAPAMNVPNYYGLEPVSTDPVLAAPTQYPNGGVIYFDSGWKWEIIEAALSLIGVRFNEREFGIFQGEAREPIREQRRAHRIIPRRHGHPPDSGPAHTDRRLHPAVLPRARAEVGLFKPPRNCRWGRRLAKERLAFGFFMENQYWGIYRLWSRPWLLTK
jgi:hypothetical protein